MIPMVPVFTIGSIRFKCSVRKVNERTGSATGVGCTQVNIPYICTYTQTHAESDPLGAQRFKRQIDILYIRHEYSLYTCLFANLLANMYVCMYAHICT